MKLHQQGKKVQLVANIEEIAQMAGCLAGSQHVADRILAFKLVEAIKDLNERSEGK